MTAAGSRNAVDQGHSKVMGHIPSCHCRVQAPQALPQAMLVARGGEDYGDVRAGAVPLPSHSSSPKASGKHDHIQSASPSRGVVQNGALIEDGSLFLANQMPCATES